MSSFVIKATDPGGTYMAWIGHVGRCGLGSVTEKAEAEVFSTREEADKAFNQIASFFIKPGIKFKVEPAERIAPLNSRANRQRS